MSFATCCVSVIYDLSLKVFSQSPGQIFPCQYPSAMSLEICRSSLSNIIINFVFRCGNIF